MPRVRGPGRRLGGVPPGRGRTPRRHAPKTSPRAREPNPVDDVTRLLSELVAIPSVNPMGRPMSGPGTLEGGMSDHLERWFGMLGIPCERQPVSAGRDNLL